MKMIDLTGLKIGRLYIIRRATDADCAIGKHVKWVARCDCGKITFPSTNHLRNGHTQSCGCQGLERATAAKIKHGDARSGKRSRLYRIWAAMLRRCRNPNIVQWKYYGGKGVNVCKAWHDFPQFKKWAMANGYKDDLTIDRINSDGNYTPANCHWITLSENISRSHKK